MLSCADIGLVTLEEGQEGLSVPSKTFGLMAAGVPIIGVMSSFSETARVINEEGCGIVIKPKDVDGLKKAIIFLYGNPEIRKSMSENARSAIDSKYSLNKAAESYKRVVMEIIENTQ